MRRCDLSAGQRKRIIHLLRTTEMSETEIANRIECSRSTISHVNQDENIRNYQGRHSSWIVNSVEESSI